MATRKLTEGNPLKLIILFMLPVFFGNLFQLLYNVIDAMIVGRIIGISALGAIGATSSIVYLITSFIFAATQGFSMVLGQRFGAKDYKRVKKSFACSMILSFAITVILVILCVPFARNMLVFMETPHDIIEMSFDYLFIIFAGIPATVFYNSFANTIRALGDSKVPLLFLMISAILNVLLDLFFISYLHFGVEGAAWATVISQMVSAILCFIYMHFKFPLLKLKLKDWKTSWAFMYKHIRIGIPMGFQISILTIGKIILQFVLNRFGSIAVAAFTTGMRIDQIFFQIYLALGITMANYTAQNYGAGKIERIKEGANISMTMVAIISTIAVVILHFFSEPIVSIFMKVPDKEIIDMASQYLHIIMIFLFFLGTLLVFRNILQGIGNVVAPVISGVAELIVRGSFAVLLGISFGYSGLCFATPSAWIIGAVVLFIGYELGIDKKKSL